MFERQPDHAHSAVAEDFLESEALKESGAGDHSAHWLPEVWFFFLERARIHAKRKKADPMPPEDLLPACLQLFPNMMNRAGERLAETNQFRSIMSETAQAKIGPFFDARAAGVFSVERLGGRTPARLLSWQRSSSLATED